MGGLVDQFENFERKLKDNREFKQRERARKKEDRVARATSTAITLPPPSQKYRDNWERIFGNKSRNSFSGESAGMAEGEGLEVHQDPAAVTMRRS